MMKVTSLLIEAESALGFSFGVSSDANSVSCEIQHQSLLRFAFCLFKNLESFCFLSTHIEE